jgi:hypothetical protein
MSRAKPVSRLPLGLALKRSIVASVVAFALLMGVLSVRMAIGSDPALAPKLASRGQRSSSSDSRSQAVAPVPVQPSTAAPVTQPAPAPAPVQTTTS